MEFLQFLEPWMIPIVVMICVTVIVIVSSITKIITTSMKEKNKSGDLTANKEFLNALREFKENMDTRVRNLEEISASEKPATEWQKNRDPRKQNTIELELDDDKPNENENESKQSSRLKNMLNQ